MSDADVLLSAQQILEENEDIFAAVVENLQLGRMEECIKHYSVLHRNVVAMAQALDNYPTSIKDPHETVKLFPDDIMRKDVLDELQPPGQTALPKAPPAPPCSRCAVQKFSAHKCRVELEHIEPNAQFTYTERIEFLQVAQLLEMKDRQQKSDNCKANKPKRTYQLWTASERYLLLLGIALYGVKAYENISKLFEDRSMSQIRSFIGKRLTADEIADAVAKKLPEPPEDFRFPKRLGEVVDAYGKFTDDVLSGKVDLASFALSSASEVRAGAAEGAAARQYPSSVIAPRSGPFDWASMLGIASSTDDAVSSVPSSDSGNNGSSSSSSLSAPKLPTLAGILLMQPSSIDTQTPAAEPTPKSRGNTATSAEGGPQRPTGKAKKAHAAAKKNAKLNKAILVNREGDEIMLTQTRKRNKSIGSSEESGSPMANSSSGGVVRGKGKKNAGDQNKKSKSSKRNADAPQQGIRSAFWTPWVSSTITTSDNTNTNNARNFSMDQSSRFFNMSNHFGMENSMALLPDTYSNFSVPPLSPSQASNMLYLPGDSESSLALLPLDLSMSSPTK